MVERKNAGATSISRSNDAQWRCASLSFSSTMRARDEPARETFLSERRHRVGFILGQRSFS